PEWATATGQGLSPHFFDSDVHSAVYGYIIRRPAMARETIAAHHAEGRSLGSGRGFGLVSVVVGNDSPDQAQGAYQTVRLTLVLQRHPARPALYLRRPNWL